MQPHSQDAAAATNHMIKHWWPELQILATEIRPDQSEMNAKESSILIPPKKNTVRGLHHQRVTYKLIRDFPSAMESYIRLQHQDDLKNFDFEKGHGMHHTVGSFFVVTFQRIHMLSANRRSQKDTTRVIGNEVVKIYDAERKPVYGLLQSFVVHIGEYFMLCQSKCDV
jgi:hypothetical protein